MKNKIDWEKLKRKIGSRKLWVSISGVIIAVVTLASGNAELAERIAAIALAAGSVIAYLVAEGSVDAASADKQPETHVYQIQEQPYKEDDENE